MLHGKVPRSRLTRIGTKGLFCVLTAALMVCWEAGVSAAQPAPSGSQSSVETTLPADFPVIINPYLGVPVVGFGSKLLSSRRHLTMIFLHGNNDTPFPTSVIRSRTSATSPSIFLKMDTKPASCGVLATRVTSATS